jgi:hypothetical protein
MAIEGILNNLCCLLCYLAIFHHLGLVLRVKMLGSLVLQLSDYLFSFFSLFFALNFLGVFFARDIFFLVCDCYECDLRFIDGVGG